MQESNVEKGQKLSRGIESSESEIMTGADMLENPAQNDYIQGFNTFISWEKSQFANHK